MNNYANIENLDWYHTIELKPGYFTRGRYDWRPYLKQFDFGDLDGKTVLDVGCGLGGAARFVVNKYHNRVTL